MELTVFMDETNRSGQQRYKNEKWNFNDKPFFGLGALFIPSKNADSLKCELKELISLEHFESPFKWSNKQARNRSERLFPLIVAIFEKHNGMTYFEIESKRFTIAKIITEYCVCPHYLSSAENSQEHIVEGLIKRAMANLIYARFSDSLMWEYCEFFDSGNHDTAILKDLIKKLSVTVHSKYITDACNDVIDIIEGYENGKLAAPIQKQHLFPVLDTIQFNNTTKQLTIDAHTDCFGHLLSLAPSFFPTYFNIHCLHDIQTQWEPALRETISRLACVEKCREYNYSLDFISGDDIIINSVDYITGYINQCLLNKLRDGRTIPDKVLDYCKTHLNIVACVDEQQIIVPDSSIPTVRNLMIEMSK